VGSRGGVLTAWKEGYTLNTSYTLTFSNTILLTNNLGFSFMVTNVYGPTVNNLKTDFIMELRMIACLHDLPWQLLGDFNITRDLAKSTSTNPNTHDMVEFNEMIADLQMREITLYGRSFTWPNMRPNTSFSKLDRMLLSQHWDSIASHISYITDLPTPTSDHAPLSLKFKKIDNQVYRTFTFERHWLQYDEAMVLSREAWDLVQPTNNPAKNLIEKFKRVTRVTTEWSRKKIKSYNKLIQRTKHIIQILDRAEENRILSGPELRLRIALKEHAYSLSQYPGIEMETTICRLMAKTEQHKLQILPQLSVSKKKAKPHTACQYPYQRPIKPNHHDHPYTVNPGRIQYLLP
jgi:hypothetical protein